MNKDKKKIKILAVEDDQKCLKLLSILLEDYGFTYDTAINGLEAWEKIQKDDYDLIVSDWNMPGMDGNQLLRKIREYVKTQKTPFLMLTARADVDSISTAVKVGVTDYVIKPYEELTLIGKIEKLLKKSPSQTPDPEGAPNSADDKSVDQKSISLKVMELIGKGTVDFPTMPQVVFAIEEMIKREDLNIHDLAELIVMDVGIATKLIGVANSVAYRGLEECTKVEEAIGRIGMKEAGRFVHLIANRNLFALKDSRFEKTTMDLYVHSVAVGIASQSIAKHLKIAESDKYYLLGLLHDIGKLLVLQVLSPLTKDMREMKLDFFLDVMNTLHNKAGSILLARWSFSPIFSSVALNHQDVSFSDKPETEVLVVHFANLFVRELGFSIRDVKAEDLLTSKSAKLLGLNAEILEKVTGEVKEYVEKVTSIL